MRPLRGQSLRRALQLNPRVNHAQGTISVSLAVYSSSGRLAGPCPRCRAEASVEIKSLARRTRLAMTTVFVVAAASQWLVPQHMVEAQAVIVGVFLFEVLAGEKARCQACGSTLQKELGDGWR